MFALHLKTKNDTNGNPRRIYLVCSPHGPVAAVDEGYSGVGALREAGFDPCPVVWDIEVTPGEYRAIRRSELGKAGDQRLARGNERKPRGRGVR